MNKKALFLSISLIFFNIKTMDWPYGPTEKRIIIQKIHNNTNIPFTFKDLRAPKSISDVTLKPNETVTLNKEIIIEGKDNNKAILLFESSKGLSDLALQLHKDPETQKLNSLLGSYKDNSFEELLQHQEYNLKIDSSSPDKDIPMTIFINGNQSKFEVPKKELHPSSTPKKFNWKIWKKLSPKN